MNLATATYPDSYSPSYGTRTTCAIYPWRQHTLPHLLVYEPRLDFIKSYLRTVQKESQAEEERIMMEIKVFSLASHLFWGLWSIVNAKLSEIPFGYWDYAVCRLQNYQCLKEKLLIPGPPTLDGAIRRKVTDTD